MRRFFCFILILVSVYMMATKGFSPERIYFRRASSAAEGSPLATVHLSTENIPDAQIQLAVPYIYQLPELRNGCEITSSAMICVTCFSICFCVFCTKPFGRCLIVPNSIKCIRQETSLS